METVVTGVSPGQLTGIPHSVQAKRINRGILALTNRRLVWLEQRGVFNVSYHPVATIRLEDIKGIASGGMIMPYVTITDSIGAHLFHLEGMTSKQFPEFKRAILSQVSTRNNELESLKKREGVQGLPLGLPLDYSRDDTRVGQCPRCSFPCYISNKLLENAFQDSNYPLTLQGDCPKCGTKVGFYQDVQSICEYCKKPQAKRGQTRCHECGANYPVAKKFV